MWPVTGQKTVSPPSLGVDPPRDGWNELVFGFLLEARPSASEQAFRLSIMFPRSHVLPMTKKETGKRCALGRQSSRGSHTSILPSATSRYFHVGLNRTLCHANAHCRCRRRESSDSMDDHLKLRSRRAVTLLSTPELIGPRQARRTTDQPPSGSRTTHQASAMSVKPLPSTYLCRWWE